MPLTETRLRALKPKDKPYKVADDRGLYVEVTPSGGKLWRFRYRIGKLEKKLSIGNYPDISLKDARQATYEARQAVARGGDPALEKRKQKIRSEFLSAQTFEAVAREYIEQMMVQNGRAEGTVVKANYFLDQLVPAIGKRPIDQIEPFEILAPLKRLEAQGKHETAKKCRSFAGRVFRYGVATTRCQADPTSMLKGALVTPRATHYAAIIEPTELGGLLRSIDDYTGYPITKFALQIAPHVFVRPGELRQKKMEEAASVKARELGLAWVRPTLGAYVCHDLIEGLSRLSAEPAPLNEAEAEELSILEADYDREAAVLEDEDSSEEEVARAEEQLARIDRAMRALNDRPPVLAEDLKEEAGAFLVLSRGGEPTLVPQYYTASEVAQSDEGIIEPVEDGGDASSKPAAYSQRLLDELAMQRRDVLAIHLVNDPGLALDLMIFTLADADGHDWRAKKAVTISGPAASGPVSGFEAKDAPASAALAEFTGSLDESWRAGASEIERFSAFRGLSDEARGLWLGFVVARTLIASLNTDGDRGLPLHDALGSLLEIEMAHWWRPTAANFFDRVPKARILEAFDAVGGPELVSRYAGSQKADLASAAERIFSGEFIGEADVKEQALAWVPAVMRFGTLKEKAAENEETSGRPEDASDQLTEKAA